MTVDEAIKALETLRWKHGGDTPVYFDCPKCDASFTPDLVAAQRRVVAPAQAKPTEAPHD